MNSYVISIMVLGSIALVAAMILYVCLNRFAVRTDPRVVQVMSALPQANCGGCGYPGCSGLAGALVKAADKGSLNGLACPVGGQDTMGKIADILGVGNVQSDPMIAVVRCAGSYQKRKLMAEYSGLATCAAVNMCGTGETACGYGCLGCGDCVATCSFGALSIDSLTRLPVVDENKCTACGACVKACPRNIIELRKKGLRDRRVYIPCMNHDRGPVAMRACDVSCIGCGKCKKECRFDAIVVENNLAYIDSNKCRLCRKCEKVCPRNIITAVNFPVRKIVGNGSNMPDSDIKSTNRLMV